MRRSSLLACAFSAALLAACTTSTPPPSSAAISQTPPPLSVAFVPCHTNDLEMQLISLGVALGNVGGLIEVRNKSSQECDLYGYAGLQLLDSIGRPLPTEAVWADNSYIFGSNLVETVVELPAGTVPIRAYAPVQGHAYIPISWNEIQQPCVTPAQFRVTPPDAATSLVISAIPAGGGPARPYVCSNVIVNPTRAASDR